MKKSGMGIYFSRCFGAACTRLSGRLFFSGNQRFMAPAGKFFEPDAKSFQFAIVSDSGSQNLSLQKIIKRIREKSNRFILYLGDLVTYRTSSHFA